MKIYTRLVLQMTDSGFDDEPLISEHIEYSGDVAQCGFFSDIFGDDDDGKIVQSDQEIALLDNALAWTITNQDLFTKEQLPYDLSVLAANKDLLPGYHNYIKSQLGDAQTDLALNRVIKDEMSGKALRDIQRQDALGDLEFQRAVRNDDLIEQEIKRNDTYNAFIDKQMDWASDYNDYAQYEIGQAKENNKKADAHYGKMLESSDKLGVLADDYNKLGSTAFNNAMSIANDNDLAMRRLGSEKLGLLDADLEGVAGRASADTYSAYETSRDALRREQARLGVNPTSGARLEQDRLQAMDYAKANALGRTQARDAEDTRVENANLERTKANWGKDLDLISNRNSAISPMASLAASMYGTGSATALGSANALAQAPGSAAEFTKNNVRSSDLLGSSMAAQNMNNFLTKSSNLLPYGVTAKDYSAMMNGGFGVNNGYNAVGALNGGTDFASLASAAGQTAAQGPEASYVPNNGNSTFNSLIGAAGTVGAAWLMGG